MKRIAAFLFGFLFPAIAFAAAPELPNLATLAAYPFPAQMIHAHILDADGNGNPGDYAWKDPAPFTADGKLCLTPTASGTWTGCWLRAFSGDVQLSWYGVTTNGADKVANAAKINEAAAAARYFGVGVTGLGRTVKIPVDAELDFSGTRGFFDAGITAWGAAGSFPDSGVVYAAGTPTDLGALSGDVAVNATSITLVTAPPAAVVAGSTIYLVDGANGSFNPARTYYHAGEAVSGLSVSGSTINLTSALRYAYPAATAYVTYVAPTTARFENLDVTGVSNTSGVVPIAITMGGHGAGVVHSRGTGSSEAGIYILESVGVECRGNVTDTMASTLAGLNYGTALANDQDVSCDGDDDSGARHGEAIGVGGDDRYAITNHNTGFINGIARTLSQASPVNAADMHGNCDGCIYRNETIYGGIEVGGMNNYVQGNRIYCGSGYGYSIYCILSSELLGFENRLDHNTLNYRGDASSSSYGMIDLADAPGGYSTELKYGGLLDFSGTTLNFYVTNGGFDQYAVEGEVKDTTASPLNISFRGAHFNLLGAAAGATYHGVSLRSVSTAHFGTIDISDTSGDVGWDLANATNIIATGVNTSDLSGSAFNTGIRPLKFSNISGTIDAKSVSTHGAPSGMEAVYIAGTTSPTINLMGLSTQGATGTDVYIVNGPSTGTGANVTIGNFDIGGTLTVSNLSSSLKLGAGWAASYSIGSGLEPASFGYNIYTTGIIDRHNQASDSPIILSNTNSGGTMSLCLNYNTSDACGSGTLGRIWSSASSNNLKIGTGQSGGSDAGVQLYRSSTSGAFDIMFAQVTRSSHLEFHGTAPTVGFGSGDCGTSPSVTANSTDAVGRLTVGSSTNGGHCTVTFETAVTPAWAAAPVCMVSDETSAVAVRPGSVSTTSFQIVGAIVAGDTLAWECFGYHS